MLPHVIAHFAPAIPAVMACLGAALRDGPSGEPAADDDVAGALHDLGRRLGTPAGLRAIGMTDEQLEAMIELVHAGAAGAEHPARVDEPAVRAILTGALAGDRPLRSPVAEAA